MKTLKLFLFAVMLLCAAMVRGQNGDEIIQKHIDAIGGADNWAKVTSMKMTGGMNVQGMDISMTQTIVNDKGMRTDISVMGITGYTIITPTEGWMYMPIQPGMDKVTPIPPEELKASQDKINVRSMQLVDKSRIAKSEYLGTDTISHVGCLKVKVTDKDGNMQTAFFDPVTYYMVRTTSKIKMQDEEHEVEVNFSNFQKLPEGITMPMAWGTQQGDITFKSIEVNKTYEDSIFKPDADTKK